LSAYSAPPDPLAALRGLLLRGGGKGRGGVLLLRGREVRRGRREWEEKGGKRKGKGEREGRKGNEEGPTKNSCRGAQNVKLRHCAEG